MKFNLATLRAEWKRANRSMRYFLINHVLANVLLAIASIASVVLGALGHAERQMILLGVAVLCAGQAILAWTVLQRRFKVRYSLW